MESERITELTFCLKNAPQGIWIYDREFSVLELKEILAAYIAVHNYGEVLRQLC